MKSLLTTIIITIVSLSTYAGGGAKYEKAMNSAIQEVYSANELNEFDAVANKLTRIGEAEKDQWHPYYYSALANLFKSFKIEDLKAKDAALDQAHVELAKASKVDGDNSEIVALTGFVNMIKIEVDPGTRGQTLSPKIMADFGRAMQLDPQNPRATLFMGQMQYGMAQFFGKGQEDACKTVIRSIELFDNADSDDILAPAWGRESAIQYKKMCSTAPETKVKSE